MLLHAPHTLPWKTASRAGVCFDVLSISIRTTAQSAPWDHFAGNCSSAAQGKLHPPLAVLPCSPLFGALVVAGRSFTLAAECSAYWAPCWLCKRKQSLCVFCCAPGWNLL